MISAALALLLAAAPPVSLTIDPCAGVEAAEVRRILELELAATRASIRGLTGVVACDGDALAFEVEDPLTGKQLSRQVELARAAPNARARLLALAMVEAVEASWDEVLYAPVPAPLPEPEPAPAPAPLPSPPMVVAPVEAPTPADERPRYHVSLVGLSRGLLEASMMQHGGGLRFVHTPFRYFGWAGELTAEHGQLVTFLGTVQMTSAGGALEALGQYALGRFTFQLAAGLRGGGVTARGVPFGPLITAKEAGGAWVGPFSAFSTTFGFSRWFAAARLEAGATVVGVPAHVDSVRTGMAGPWLGLALGFGFRM